MTVDLRNLESAFFCEVRPVANGFGFDVVARHRILGWYVDEKGNALPITAFGRVSLKAFKYNPRSTRDGMGLIETRATDGPRRWIWPLQPKEQVDDLQVKRWMCKLRDNADEFQRKYRSAPASVRNEW